MKTNLLFWISLCLLTSVWGQIPKAKKQLLSQIDANAPTYTSLAAQIWDFAELGYQEENSSALLQARLKEAGFSIETGVAGMPTGFIASYGSGEPVIGILAEFDALPGLSQDTSAVRSPIEGKVSGHACGHHLFGAASVGAAITVKNWLQKNDTQGTLRLYGTPAEEGGAGKVYMVREGLFDDVDAVLHWHPDDQNNASPRVSLANKSAKFRFYGVSAHASAFPHMGRSALDGVEAMNAMVNMMREHILPESRIHYVITQGGDAPNIVPEFAEVYYFCRHPDATIVQANFERIVKCAKGAAMGTETRMEYEVIHGLYNMIPNEVLSKVVYDNMLLVGGVSYDASELAYAAELRKTLRGQLPPMSDASEIQPFGFLKGGGSTDVGDISWVVPTAGPRVATWVPGVPSHSWQAVSCGGRSLGMKGMTVATKTIALSAYDLFMNVEVITQAKKELKERVGEDFKYEALLGDRPPALDYRR